MNTINEHIDATELWAYVITEIISELVCEYHWYSISYEVFTLYISCPSTTLSLDMPSVDINGLQHLLIVA